MDRRTEYTTRNWTWGTHVFARFRVDDGVPRWTRPDPDGTLSLVAGKRFQRRPSKRKTHVSFTRVLPRNFGEIKTENISRRPEIRGGGESLVARARFVRAAIRTTATRSVINRTQKRRRTRARLKNDSGRALVYYICFWFFTYPPGLDDNDDDDQPAVGQHR